jgi:hypothetical protein
MPHLPDCQMDALFARLPNECLICQIAKSMPYLPDCQMNALFDRLPTEWLSEN